MEMKNEWLSFLTEDTFGSLKKTHVILSATPLMLVSLYNMVYIISYWYHICFHFCIFKKFLLVFSVVCYEAKGFHL